MNVKLEQLSKHFGSVIAVQHMNAVLKPGITGLLGANGSGKNHTAAHDGQRTASR